LLCFSYISAFYSVLEGGNEYDLFAKALLAYSEKAGSTMAILCNVLKVEFQENEGTPTAIMRGNTAASRILGIYCRILLSQIHPIKLPLNFVTISLTHIDQENLEGNIYEKHYHHFFKASFPV
jgi:hypothetical protein